MGVVVVMEHLPVVLNETDSASTWADLGSALALLNSIRGRRSFAVPVAQALRDQLAKTEGTDLEADVRRLVERLAPLGSLPATGVIHGEANPANAGRRADGELVLLDWDQAGAAPSALDYGYPLLTCHVSESLRVNDAAIGAFYRGYRAAGGEIDPSLAFDAALFHALRYMWFANTELRWQRIQFALRSEADLTDLLRSGT